MQKIANSINVIDQKYILWHTDELVKQKRKYSKKLKSLQNKSTERNEEKVWMAFGENRGPKKYNTWLVMYW